MAPPGNNSNDSKKITKLEKNSEDQANTIAKLENEIKKLGDPNANPRIIQKGNQVYPKYQRNNKMISATIPKEKPQKKQKE